MILTVHHPLHPLHPRDNTGWFTKFFTSNGEEVERLLDSYPNVKLVLSGHHHAHRLIRRPGRLHLNTAALTGYPCFYRLVRIHEADGGWHVEATTEHAADEDLVLRSRQLSVESFVTEAFDPDDRYGWVNFLAGRPEDRAFSGVI